MCKILNNSISIPPRKQSYVISVLKIICAIFVVQIHTPSALREFIDPVTRIAVPVFFMISGYFLSFAIGEFRGSYKRTFVKLLKIVIVANLIYLIAAFICPAWDSDGEPLNRLKLVNIAKLLILGRNISFHLWYLVAYLQAVGLFWLFRRIKSESLYMTLCVFCLCLNLAFGNYYFIWSDEAYSYYYWQNTFATAVPFVLIGSIIRKYENKITMFPLLLAALIVIPMMYVERYLISSAIHTALPAPDTVFTILFAIIVFAVCVKIKDWQVGYFGRFFALMGKKHSLGLYIMHPLIYLIVRGFIPIEFLNQYGTVLVVIATLAMLIFCDFAVAAFKKYIITKDYAINHGVTPVE